ncbi:MAG: hypothetical protein KBA46_01240 [Candidatus Omnitrophica bacterium]|nr:hypothetical protein [Candidatus Omnitrophota bacterium]
MRGRHEKAQSFLQYGLLIIFLVASFLAIRTYMTRGIQDRYRQAADVFGQGEQYAPGVTRVYNFATLPDVVIDGDDVEQTCAALMNRALAAQAQIANNDNAINSLNERAASLEAQAHQMMYPDNIFIRFFNALFNRDYREAAEQLNDQAKEMREEAERLQGDSDDLQAQIDSDRAQRPECFSG